MPKQKVKAVEYRCDNCGEYQIHTEESDFLGLTGTVYENHSGGGNTAEWFACSRACVGQAIEAALDRRD